MTLPSAISSNTEGAVNDSKTGNYDEEERNSKNTVDSNVNTIGKYNLDVLNDISKNNPFETKLKINTSIEILNTPVASSEGLTITTQDEEANLASTNDDLRDSILSPADLPNLEMILSHGETENTNCEIVQNNILQQSPGKEPENENIGITELKRPNAIDVINNSPHIRRKDSTPEFEEAERKFMMEENPYTSIHIAKPYPIPNSYNSLSKEKDVFDENLEKEATLLAQQFHNEDNLKVNRDESQLVIKEEPSIMPSSKKESLSAVISRTSISVQELDTSKNPKAKELHYEECSNKHGVDNKNAPEKHKYDFARKELHYQATLLEKDKLLHDKEKRIQSLDQDVLNVKKDIEKLEFNNKGMLTVVNEYEKTISEVISDREREKVCDEIAKEKLKQQRDQTLEDLHSAERAFNDVHR